MKKLLRSKYKEIRANIFSKEAEAKTKISTEMSKKELEDFEIS